MKTSAKEARADLAAMRAAMPLEERQARIARAVGAFRRELLGLATLEVHVPTDTCMVVTVRSDDGSPIARAPAKDSTTTPGTLGSIR